MSSTRCIHSSRAFRRLVNCSTTASRPLTFACRVQPPQVLDHVQHRAVDFPRRHHGPQISVFRPPHLRPSPPPSILSSLQTSRSYATRTLPTQNATPSSPTTPSPRHLYSRARRKRTTVQSRSKTSQHSNGARNRQPREEQSASSSNGKNAKAGTGFAAPQSKHMVDRLPHMARFHRPTKEQLLAAATGFWSRLRVRFKWFSIRSLRPYNMDDISAFFSWILLGHVIWILVGTTTFFSLVILAVNTVFAQETLARQVGNYLTKSSGVKVVFESAIVPRWKDGVITFKNVFVSRRPGQQKADVRKGSQTAAAAAAAELASERAVAEDEDTNYTQYDLSFETVNVTLSFAKWFNGHGLLRDVEVKGVRGVLDRTAVHYSDEYIDPRSYRHEHNTGDFEIESFKMDDLLISVYQPNNFRPFSVSIFSADLPRLRKQWLFYDFLSANHMSGSFDESLFTIHPRQTHNYTGAQLVDRESDEKDHWDKQSRIRIDGLKIDHLNRGVEGPFSWIHEGNVDIVADVMFPSEAGEGIVKAVSDFYDRVEAQVMQQRAQPSQAQAQAQAQGEKSTWLTQLSNPIEQGVINNRSSRSSQPPETTTPNPNNSISSPPASTNNQKPTSPTPPPVIFDLHLTLTSVHATVPLFPGPHISYINSALIRPIVAYINNHSSSSTPLSRRPHIPISCRVVKPLNDFEGSWTVFDSGLLEDLSRETYGAFVGGLGEGERQRGRMRKVGFWGLRVLVQALAVGLAGGVGVAM